MIHDELVTYEVAKLAKEKGFPQDPNKNGHCEMYCWDGLRNIHSLGTFVVWYMEEYNHDNLYAAPSQSLLQRWLRKKKNIHIEIVATACGYFWIADKINGTAITDTIFAATYLDIKPHITYECSVLTDTGIDIDIIKANTKEKVIWVVHCPVCGKDILATEGEKIM